jgi:hypothetical protein
MTDTPENHEDQEVQAPPPGPDEVAQKDIQKNADPGFFSRRLRTSDFPVGDTTFKVRAIPATLNKEIIGNNTSIDYRGIPVMNNQGVILDMFRYGVTDIVGGRDEAGSPVVFESEQIRIAGAMRSRVKQSLVDMLPLEIIVNVAGEIKRLSELDSAARERLGFFTGIPDSE